MVFECFEKVNRDINTKLMKSKIDHEYSGCTSIQLLIDP